jgi:antirestriction protein ArdC
MSRHSARALTGSDRTSLYDEITAKIIAEVEAGRVPWAQPWGTAAAKAPLGMPKNAATGRRYSGINVLILWRSVTERDYVQVPPPEAYFRPINWHRATLQEISHYAEVWTMPHGAMNVRQRSSSAMRCLA